MSFSVYPAYKNSNIEWLGEVPAHWVLTPIKHLALLNPRKSDFDGDTKQLCSFVPMEKLKTGVVLLDEVRPIDEVIEGYTYFEDGDVLQAKVTPCFENKNVAIAKILKNGVGFGSSEINVFRPYKGVSAEYLYYRVQENSYMTFCTSSMIGAGGLKRVPTDVINNFTVAAPKLSEQTQIARFLDNETARIDGLIEEQHRLIELLKEKRQAVISHAVTKGLDPTVPMKDSGVEWLGEVPAHWEALTLGRVADGVKTGGTPSDNLPSSDVMDGVEWFTPGDFASDLRLVGSDKFVSKLAVKSGDAKVFPAGAVLIVSIGATLGKVGYILKSASANQQINVVIPSSKIDGYFLAYSLSVKVDAMRFLSNSSTIGIMNQEKTKEIWLSLPSLKEQQLITDFLDKQASVIDTLIREASGGVSLLQERRSALISAAVTGKIDVRGWQPSASVQAPELVEEAV